MASLKPRARNTSVVQNPERTKKAETGMPGRGGKLHRERSATASEAALHNLSVKGGAEHILEITRPVPPG
ncbi:hypothetical protein H920_01314 [Fukomys damarensis]|uniref:Uncharacterized protein n=1 Tax=Fukomys damarensis TaxID=885580 RepID=A0A091E3K8_FUKDA|nr:hypothetical protein H920_01314 [Fukomys damarensis]